MSISFKTWIENVETQPFPGSTVPYLVYHGTSKRPFKQFEYQKGQRFILFSALEVEAKGFFFSESPHDAVEYGPNVVACYINLRKPLLDPRRERHLGIDRLSREQEIDLQKVLAPLIQRDEHGPFIELGVGRQYLQTRYTSGMDWIYHAVKGEGLSWDALDSPGVVERMVKLGYDGTFVAEPETSLGRSIFVPSKDQIHIVKWVNGPQEDWGEKDDFYTSKYKDGKMTPYQQFYGPGINP